MPHLQPRASSAQGIPSPGDKSCRVPTCYIPGGRPGAAARGANEAGNEELDRRCPAGRDTAGGTSPANPSPVPTAGLASREREARKKITIKSSGFLYKIHKFQMRDNYIQKKGIIKRAELSYLHPYRKVSCAGAGAGSPRCRSLPCVPPVPNPCRTSCARGRFSRAGNVVVATGKLPRERMG